MPPRFFADDDRCPPYARLAGRGRGAVHRFAVNGARPRPRAGPRLRAPNKIGLSQTDYFVVQQIYAGWNRLAILLAIQLASMLALAVMSRRRPEVFWPVL